MSLNIGKPISHQVNLVSAEAIYNYLDNTDDGDDCLSEMFCDAAIDNLGHYDDITSYMWVEDKLKLQALRFGFTYWYTAYGERFDIEDKETVSAVLRLMCAKNMIQQGHTILVGTLLSSSEKQEIQRTLPAGAGVIIVSVDELLQAVATIYGNDLLFLEDLSETDYTIHYIQTPMSNTEEIALIAFKDGEEEYFDEEEDEYFDVPVIDVIAKDMKRRGYITANNLILVP